MSFVLKSSTAAILALLAGSAFAANTGGFATADGNIATARKFTANSHTAIQAIIDAARYNDAGTKVSTGAYPLHITYTGNEDALIAQMIKDHTVGADGSCPNPRWSEAYRKVEVKNYTAGVTIEGANGSSANFGIVLNGGSSNIVVKNMKIGALAGASNDADMMRVDSASNVLIDHNELFAVNNECKGSPDGDLTFESAIDIKKASHNITVSYNVIRDSKKVGLDGSSSSDIDGGRELTFHHNVYKNVNARLPLQRGGWTHMYNNLYDGITGSGINVRQAGYALIEKNYFVNANNPVVCFYDGGSNCGWWDLRGNNIASAADFATYNIVWTTPQSGDKNAAAWTTTAVFPKTLSYTYEPVSPQCVKDKLAQYAGVGKNGAVLTASACGSSTSSSSAAASSAAASSVAASSSAASSSKASSSAAASSAASSSKASSSAAASSAASSSAASSAPTAPVLSGTGDYPSGYSKCADLGGTCTAKATGWVAFGRKGKWVSKYVGSGKTIACTVAAFGSDPLGNPNKCSTK